MIQNLEIIELNKFQDERGEFIRIYDENRFTIKKGTVKQVNISRNPLKHTLRGLHFQKERETEHKILYLNSGEIFLVIVDLRKESQTYLNKIETNIKSNVQNAIFIPAGCATGWLSLKNDSEIVYLMYDRFENCLYDGIRYDDPTFKIKWPHEPKVISKKDLEWDYYLNN